MHIVKHLPLLAVVALVGCELSTSEPPPDPGIAAAERAVKRMLLDPESARFTNVGRHPETGANPLEPRSIDRSSALLARSCAS